MVLLLAEKEQTEKVRVQEELQQHLAEAQAEVRRMLLLLTVYFCNALDKHK